jgi:hypothetical protein
MGNGMLRPAARFAATSGIALALLTTAALPSFAGAGALLASALRRPLVAVDWQGPLSLPPRFRNHCSYSATHGGWYCSNHCGIDYQFYFCTPASFGCCKPGFGYCDWKGHLRCAP